jgi:SAM-dependent methyltransferase
MPPDELIDRVVGRFSNEDAETGRAHFHESGRESVEDLGRALAAVGDALADHEHILEFGCGCGRIMRWMADVAQGRTLIGIDIDARAIAWARANIPFATFEVNEGLPPTRFADGKFDLVVNHSVFTHVDAHYQDLWLAELQRITAPGGKLVLTVHGAYGFQFAEQQLDPGSRERLRWRETLERDGNLYIAEDSFVGSSFPDFYHTAFHAPWYVLEHWAGWFDVLAYLPRSSLGLQDQVVLRRRADTEDATPPVRARAGEAGESSMHHPRTGANVPLEAGPLLCDGVLQAPDAPSRFGALGLLARRAVFRAARPVLHAQHDVDRRLAAWISELQRREGERMPPLVAVALRKQAERIERLDREVQELRRSVDRA